MRVGQNLQVAERPVILTTIDWKRKNVLEDDASLDASGKFLPGRSPSVVVGPFLQALTGVLKWIQSSTGFDEKQLASTGESTRW